MAVCAHGGACGGADGCVGLPLARADAEATVMLEVEGMFCEGCRATIKRELQAMGGVTNARVNLNSGVVTVSGTATPAALIERITSAGRFRARQASDSRAASSVPASPKKSSSFPVAAGFASTATEAAGAPRQRVVWLVVEDMVCNSCHAKVDRTLRMVHGVSSVAFGEFEEHTVAATGSALAEDLMAAVSAAGYTASLLKEDDVDERGDGAPLLGGGDGGGGGKRRGESGVIEVSLTIKGMSCASCVGNVERALLGMDGVQSATVSLMTKTGKVSFTSSRVDVEDVLSKVASVGYKAEVRGGAGGGRGAGHVHEVALTIEGMSCASCVGNVERALLGMDGVQSATVSLMSKSGKVTFDSRRVDVPKIVAKVTAAGYHAE